MNGRNRRRWRSYAKTTALVLGLPTLLVLGEVLRSYAAEGVGPFGAWAIGEVSAFSGAYAYLFFATAMTAAVVGSLVKRSFTRTLRDRALRSPRVLQEEQHPSRPSPGRQRVAVATPLRPSSRPRQSA